MGDPLLLIGVATVVVSALGVWVAYLPHRRRSKGQEPKLDATLGQATAATGRPVGHVAVDRGRVLLQHLPTTSEFLLGRGTEKGHLTKAWNGNTRIVSVVAQGGEGKTSLVKHWLNDVAKQDYLGAERVFGWSFYSQGTRDTAASADQFIDQALRFFGDPDPTAGSPDEKGRRLGGLVGKGRNLLILDGLEPLQYPPGPMENRLQDPALQALLNALAYDSQGLCLVTTRVSVKELSDVPLHDRIDLKRLSAEAGVQLLKRLQVNGSDEELHAAVEEYDGHALALTLLGTLLRDRFKGEIRRHKEVKLTEADGSLSRHARHVIEAYERWFLGGSLKTPLHRRCVRWLRRRLGRPIKYTDGEVMLAVLRLIGLFDRPADSGCVNALRSEPIEGLTEPLFATDDRGRLWKDAVLQLRRARLLAEPSEGSTEASCSSLDAHPLVREYFAAQLAKRHADSAREAHRRLYEHLKQSAPELPDNLNDMMPLYHAVGHGCKAGLLQQALASVYRDRILRGNAFFSVRMLGSFGADLSALSGFFTGSWDQPTTIVNEQDQGWLLSHVANWLRALGRMAEATQPMDASVSFGVRLHNWETAAARAANLSELLLTLGDVSSAVRQGEQGVELADRSGVANEAQEDRVTLGDALHASARGLAGCRSHEASLAACREAEAMQKETQPQHPVLYSVPGYHYCDLLLGELSVFSSQSSGRDSTLNTIREVRNRAETTLEWVTASKLDILSIALDHLTLGRTYLLETRYKRLETRRKRQETEEEASALDSAKRYLNESVSLLRQSGKQDVLPRGLLHRAALWRVKYEITRDQSKIDLAERDLTEVERIAERGSMLIYQIEAALERTRLALVLGDRKRAKEKLDEACDLVRQTEKPYKPHIPDWEDWQPPEYIGVFKEGDIVGYHCRNGEIDELRKAIDQ